MKIHKIILPTPYRIGDVNAYLVKGETLTLFDTGTKMQNTYEALKLGIEEAGYSMKDVEQIVLTHHHPDHSGWVEAFPHAEIIGHPYNDYFLKKDSKFLQYREAFLRKYLALEGVPKEQMDKVIAIPGDIELMGSIPLTKYINDGEEVPGHPGLIAYYTPGHAQSHLIFVHKKTEIAISGDLILEKVTPNPLVEPPVDLSMVRPKYLVQHHQSLQKLKKFNLKKLYTGHGVDLENANEFIDMQLKKDHHRALQVLHFLQEPKTVFEITKQLYESMFQKQLGLTLSKTLGYLDYLEANHYVTAEERDGVHYYKKTAEK